jgi:hypothetical protein
VTQAHRSKVESYLYGVIDIISVKPSSRCVSGSSDSSNWLFIISRSQVEGTLYRLPRRAFEEDSEVFGTMFSLSRSQGASEGDPDGDPIHLDGIKKDDFESLLKVLIPRHVPI